MKKFVWFVLGAVMGFVTGGILGYNYVVNVVSSEMTSIASFMTNESFKEGTGSVLDRYQGQTSDVLQSFKDDFQENLEQKLKDFLQEKLDGLF